jgi:hypothetical protein
MISSAWCFVSGTMNASLSYLPDNAKSDMGYNARHEARRLFAVALNAVDTGYGLLMDEGFRMQMPLFIQLPHPKEATP